MAECDRLVLFGIIMDAAGTVSTNSNKKSSVKADNNLYDWPRLHTVHTLAYRPRSFGSPPALLLHDVFPVLAPSPQRLAMR